MVIHNGFSIVNAKKILLLSIFLSLLCGEGDGTWKGKTYKSNLSHSSSSSYNRRAGVASSSIGSNYYNEIGSR